jgi:dipeptidyl aminopeptidase/acylaminoacyl peptidase
MKKLLLFLIISVTYSANAQQKTALSAMDIAKLKAVLFTSISEDGNMIAYGVGFREDPTKENSGLKIKLYVYDVSKEISTPFVTQNNMSNVRFRPQHNSLTFTSKRSNDKTTSLYEIQLTGGEAQKIYSFTSSISSYSWHPDGSQLAFVASISNNMASELPYQPEIYEENLRSSNAYIVTIGQGEAKQISKDLYVRQIAWNHAGDQIAYGAAPSALIDESYTTQKIHVVNASDIIKMSIVDHTAKLGHFNWSPDDKKIAFIGGRDKHDPIAGRLLLANAEGGPAKILDENFKGSYDALAWKDNKTIMFMASEGVNTSLGTINLSGKVNKVIDQGSVAFTSFSLATNGALALAGSTPSHPNELFYIASDAKAATRKTNSNPWLDNKLMGKQEVITYNASDGLKIEGILISPVNQIQTQKYPMITVVHGGPEAHYNNGWLTAYSMPGQMAAGMGYAVFYPNYRGSTGRGIAFAESSQGDPAGKEFDDIIDGLDYLIERGSIDKDKVGVTGGSYGGYATAWMSTRHTERFAAGVMFVGISNNLSFWGTSDIPEEMFLVHSRQRIWDDYQFALERSPIYYAGQAKTPLLIMAGKDDTRVDPGQSYELYRHIKTRTDTPVRLVLYPGEGHGNRNSTARFDYNLRMLRWFDSYLKNSENKIPETEVSLESGGNK